MKTCTKCGETKPLTAFPKKVGCRDGHTNTCYVCEYARRKANIKGLPEHPATRTCTTCGEEKPGLMFARKLNGFQSVCKPCGSVFAKAQREMLALAPPLPPTTKRCRRCGETKPSTEFRTSVQHVDGLRHDCQACSYEVQKVWNGQRKKEPGVVALEKQCTKCGTVKPASMFHNSSRNTDKLH